MAAATVSADRMCLEGQDLLSLGARGMRAIRGRRIGMVVQDPKQGLDPLMTIGSQLVEMLRLHRKAPAAGAYSRALELLAEVHIRDPERVMGLYPHEVSGGMAQRAMLAMILSAEPDLLIADEATSALDNATEAALQTALDTLAEGRTTITIAHRLTTIEDADQVVVLDRGTVVDHGEPQQLALSDGPFARLAKARQNA